jgi:hypothetical protein
LFTLNCSTSESATESATGSVFGKSRWREREQGTHLGDAWGTARDSLRNGLPPAAACEDDGREPSSPLLLGPVWFQIFFAKEQQILCHIESLDACMKY